MRLCNNYGRGRAISITYSECVSLALGIQHAMRMRLSGCAVFSHIISLKARFSGKNLLDIKCLFCFFLQLSSETFLVLRIIQRDIIVNVHSTSCKVPVILVTL
jgi:hypothetical protein